jgi:hypothetical protein
VTPGIDACLVKGHDKDIKDGIGIDLDEEGDQDIDLNRTGHTAEYRNKPRRDKKCTDSR